MFGIRSRIPSGLAFLAAACGLTVTAHAQLFPGLNPCQPCGMPVASIAPVITTASICECPMMQPVTETVYRDVQRVEYRPEQKTVKVAKTVTVMEDRPVTTYQTVNETRTVDVQSYATQTVTECQPVTYNQSYWRTAWQPVQKLSPCQYDSRPGLLGELNRFGYSLRNTFTPNYTARREFVPNVVASQVPVQRTVQIPTTRQVTYNVAKVVPVQTTQQVAVQKVVWEDQTVTAMVPYTTTQRVAVGTTTRMAYVGPGGTTATASALEPTRATASGTDGTKSSSNDKGATRFQSAPQSQPPLQHPTHRREPEPQPTPAQGPIASGDVGSDVELAGGWRTTRQPGQEVAGPLLPDARVVKN